MDFQRKVAKCQNMLSPPSLQMLDCYLVVAPPSPKVM